MARKPDFEDPKKAIDYLIREHEMTLTDIVDATRIGRATIWRLRKGRVQTKSHESTRQILKSLAETKRDSKAGTKMAKIARRHTR